MYKFLALLISMIIFAGTIVSAQEPYCCAVPENLASPVARGITNAVGCNFFAKNSAKIAIKRLLKHNAQGDYDIKINSYSAMDLKKGKFKGLEIKGENINAKGVHISSAYLKTICDYNHVDYWQKPAVFYTDVPMAFASEITEDDLNKTFIDLGYIKQFADLSVGGLSFFAVDDVCFKLKHSKIYLLVYVKAPLLMGTKTIKITFSGKLNVEGGKVVLENLHSENLRNVNMSRLVDIINDYNPFDLPLKVFKGTDSTLCIDSVKILDNKLCVNGIMVVKRSCDGQKEEEKE